MTVSTELTIKKNVFCYFKKNILRIEKNVNLKDKCSCLNNELIESERVVCVMVVVKHEKTPVVRHRDRYQKGEG